MTPNQVRLVQESYATVRGRGHVLAQIFYVRLFVIDPTVKPLFPADLTAQHAKLSALLDHVIIGLDDLTPLLSQIQDLGRRHAAYGVAERHYASVGAALIWALEVAGGERLPRAAREAWIEAYGVLSGAMIEAARTARMAFVSPPEL